MALAKSDYLRTEGYDEHTDPETGEKSWIDRETGELVESIPVDLVKGSIVITPQQQKVREQWKKEAQRRSYGKTTRKGLGRNFTFVACDPQLRRLQPATAARLTVLSTYASFETGKLLYRNKPVTLQNLPSILKISKRTVRRFVEEVRGFMTQDDDGGFVLSTEYFLKGRLDKCRLCGKRYQQLHDMALRQVYSAVPSEQHRYLGYAFQMLEYLNVEYNFLCLNPEERELSEIEPLSCEAYCKLIGYDYSNFGRLKKVYSKLSVKINGRQESFCSFVDNGYSTRIFVNPHIVYAGSEYKKVEVLGDFCVA